MIKRIKDPVSCLTHLAGAILAIPCAVFLILYACKTADVWYIVSFSIFGAALILLYAASSVYHMLNGERVGNIFRRIDHCMIFVLIAGTYTPICLIPLRGPWGFSLFFLIWGLTLAGIVLKILWIDAPRWLSSGLYVLMGWLVMIAMYPLVNSVSTTVFTLLILGGVTYTVGAVIYAVKWPRLNFKFFGFHELFHIFVLGGSAFHVALMFGL